MSPAPPSPHGEGSSQENKFQAVQNYEGRGSRAQAAGVGEGSRGRAGPAALPAAARRGRCEPGLGGQRAAPQRPRAAPAARREQGRRLPPARAASRGSSASRGSPAPRPSNPPRVPPPPPRARCPAGQPAPPSVRLSRGLWGAAARAVPPRRSLPAENGGGQARRRARGAVAAPSPCPATLPCPRPAARRLPAPPAGRAGQASGWRQRPRAAGRESWKGLGESRGKRLAAGWRERRRSGEKPHREEAEEICGRRVRRLRGRGEGGPGRGAPLRVPVAGKGELRRHPGKAGAAPVTCRRSAHPPPPEDARRAGRPHGPAAAASCPGRLRAAAGAPAEIGERGESCAGRAKGCVPRWGRRAPPASARRKWVWKAVSGLAASEAHLTTLRG